MSTGKTDSSPAWTAPARQFVPLHLQPGNTRSSFARPDSYSLNRSNSLSTTSSALASSGATLSGGSLGGSTSVQSNASSPPKMRYQRSGFGSRPKMKAKRVGPLDAEDELPPTLSIRVMSSQESEVSELSGVLGAASNGSAQVSGQGVTTSPSPSHSGPFPRPSSSRGTPVIVFGFPPGATQSVLQYFGKFGEISENVSGSESTGSVAAAAIECGRNWLRITYKDRDAAQRALAQNGHLMPGQYVIGCVPAEPGEYTSTMQQSSTNSLLLDDSEVSMIQDQSMASVLEAGDQSEEHEISEQTPNQLNESQVLPQKIVPKEITGRFIREQSAPPPKPIHLSEINSTKLPERTAPTSLFGKLTNSVSQALFSWDI